MATAALCPKVMCEEKQRLERAVWHAVRELLALQDQDDVSSPARSKLSLARKLAIQRHDDAKRASLLHTCSICCC